MSVSITVTAYAGKNSPEFIKHYNAVVFCLENGLSYPKETSDFFRGKVGDADLEDYSPEYVLENIKDGVEVELNTTEDSWGNEVRIKRSDIPDEVDEIVIRIS